MISLRTKNYNMILVEKVLKYQTCHQANLVIKNILLVKQYYLLIKDR